MSHSDFDLPEIALLKAQEIWAVVLGSPLADLQRRVRIEAFEIEEIRGAQYLAIADGLNRLLQRVESAPDVTVCGMTISECIRRYPLAVVQYLMRAEIEFQRLAGNEIHEALLESERSGAEVMEELCRIAAEYRLKLERRT